MNPRSSRAPGFRSAETEVLAAKSRLVGVGSGRVLEAP
jgi:hypothetical protein